MFDFKQLLLDNGDIVHCAFSNVASTIASPRRSIVTLVAFIAPEASAEGACIFTEVGYYGSFVMGYYRSFVIGYYGSFVMGYYVCV